MIAALCSLRSNKLFDCLSASKLSDYGYTLDMEYSPTLGGYSMILSSGKAVFVIPPSTRTEKKVRHVFLSVCHLCDKINAEFMYFMWNNFSILLHMIMVKLLWYVCYNQFEKKQKKTFDPESLIFIGISYPELNFCLCVRWCGHTSD